MDLFRRAVANLGSRGSANQAQIQRRQDESSTAANPSLSTSASPASRPTDAAAASTDTGTTSTSSALTASAIASAAASPTDSGDHTVTDFVSTPEFTATKTTAYEAHGINGTEIHNGTSTYTADTYLATANASAHGIPHNELTACQINGTLADNGPFCSPIHQQNMWVGFTYAITWNSALLPNSNGSDLVVVRYAEGGKEEVWSSSLYTNGQGYANINMQKEWLKGQPGNDSTSGQNLTMHLISDPEGSNSTTKDGPLISLVVDPSTLPKVLIPKLPAKYGYEIGLPIGIVAALIIILALWCGCRKHQRSWKDIKGHGKDYMAKRARKRGGLGKEGGIQLEDYSAPRAKNPFTDEPYIGGTGNAFRDEVARQREEDDRFRPTVYSY